MTRPGIAHFVADVTDVVVAQVIVDPDPRRRAQAQQEPEREVEGARREVERQRRIEMQPPVTITAAVVSSVPIQRLTVSVPIDLIRR